MDLQPELASNDYLTQPSNSRTIACALQVLHIRGGGGCFASSKNVGARREGSFIVLLPRSWGRALAAIFMVLICCVMLFVATPIGSASGTLVSQLTAKGFDDTTLPTKAEMQKWWATSPLFFMGVYIGGVNFVHGTPTSTWVKTVTTQGWDLEPVWVGPQDPCWGGTGTKFSSTATTAKSQGKTQARQAYAALQDEGFHPTTDTSATVTYDMETYSGTSSCIAAAEAFVKGWDTYLHQTPSQVSGVYGSTCASYIRDYTGSPAPYFIWPAWWNTTPKVTDLTCTPSTDWSGWQRIKQYANNKKPDYGGVTLKIDEDNAHAPAYK